MNTRHTARLGLVGALALLITWLGSTNAFGAPTYDAFALWQGETQLRGANIWQRVVIPEVDGRQFLGADYVGPPYTQEDFDRLAALGANYVNISGPGIYTEKPPYTLDERVLAHWDTLLAMAEQADLFAVVTFRTGPGRSDFTFYDEDIEAWGSRELVIENVWTDPEAQAAWAEMRRAAAEHFRGNPVVVGYDLMCEPNAADRVLGIWEGETFYAQYAGTLYDWNAFYPRLVAAIRQVDPDTPILVSAMGWGSVRWLPYLKPIDDPRIVYTVHQYEPHAYTHQEPQDPLSYPATYDVDWDGEAETFDRAWLEAHLAPIEAFQARYNVPLAVNEYGVVRWAPNAAEFMRDEMALFEQHGLNHALWAFPPAWQPFREQVDAFDFLHGPDPNTHHNAIPNALFNTIRANWAQNTARPSHMR